MNISDFQKLIFDIYYTKDSSRGLERTFLWFIEEIGELAEAIRNGTKSEKENEFADVFAWLATLASIESIDLELAVKKKYGSGCPECKSSPCSCTE